MTTALLILGWLACGVVSAGFMFAGSQRKYPEIAKWCFSEDRYFAFIAIVMGVIGLLATLYVYGVKHGWL